MTYKDAWLEVAEIFKGRQIHLADDLPHDRVVVSYGEHIYGICGALGAMQRTNRITREQAAQMMAVAKSHTTRRQHYHGYWWPTTKGGHRSRVAFAKRMSKLDVGWQ